MMVFVCFEGSGFCWVFGRHRWVMVFGIVLGIYNTRKTAWASFVLWQKSLFFLAMMLFFVSLLIHVPIRAHRQPHACAALDKTIDRVPPETGSKSELQYLGHKPIKQQPAVQHKSSQDTTPWETPSAAPWQQSSTWPPQTTSETCRQSL